MKNSPHVRNIKDAGCFPNRFVFLDDATVLHRHVPPAKFHQPRTQLLMRSK